MFRAKFVGSLATLQFFFLLGKGLLFACGVDVSWGLALAPLWMLLAVAVLFWGVLGFVASKLSS
jgi:hypothetical protein